MSNYLYTWHLIPLMIFLAGWIFGGGWLFCKELKKVSIKRVRFEKGLWASIFSGTGAILVAGLIFFFFYKLGLKIESHLEILGAAVGLVVAMPVAYGIAYAALGLSAKDTLKVAVKPLVSVFGLAVLLGAAVGPITYSQVTDQMALEECSVNVSALRYCLHSHFSRYGQMPPSLQVLVQHNVIRSKQLKCPGSPNMDVGYFYLAPDKKADVEKTLVLCDFMVNHSSGRQAIFADFHSAFLSDQEFEDLLKLQVNAAFAKALAAADKK